MTELSSQRVEGQYKVEIARAWMQEKPVLVQGLVSNGVPIKY